MQKKISVKELIERADCVNRAVRSAIDYKYDPFVVEVEDEVGSLDDIKDEFGGSKHGYFYIIHNALMGVTHPLRPNDKVDTGLSENGNKELMRTIYRAVLTTTNYPGDCPILAGFETTLLKLFGSDKHIWDTYIKWYGLDKAAYELAIKASDYYKAADAKWVRAIINMYPKEFDWADIYETAKDMYEPHTIVPELRALAELPGPDA